MPRRSLLKKSIGRRADRATLTGSSLSKARRQIVILYLVSIGDRSAASICGAGLRAQRVNGHLTATEFKALFSAEI
jgi:hypothetical protein